MEQEDLVSISQELEQWEMSINDTLKQCQIGIKIVEKASLECNTGTTSDQIVKAVQNTEDNRTEADIKTKDTKKFSTEVESALIMKDTTPMSNKDAVGKITAEHKTSKSPSKLQFQCDECPVKYKWQSNLRRHKIRKHKNTRLGKKLNRKLKGVTKRRTCNWCKFTIEGIYSKSSAKTLMNAHKGNEHPFGKKCDQCEFHTTNYMSAHIKRIHSDERLICSDCGFKTIFKYILKKHQINKHIKQRRCFSE